MPKPSRLRRFPHFSWLALVVIASGATSIGSSAALAEEAAQPQTISAQDLASRIAADDAPLVLDVRTPEEFADGHLPGAKNIPHDDLADRLDELGASPDDEIVVHCHSGRRASAAEETLRDAGYSNVRDLTGHWQGWKQAGLPTE